MLDWRSLDTHFWDVSCKAALIFDRQAIVNFLGDRCINPFLRLSLVLDTLESLNHRVRSRRSSHWKLTNRDRLIYSAKTSPYHFEGIVSLRSDLPTFLLRNGYILVIDFKPYIVLIDHVWLDFRARRTTTLERWKVTLLKPFNLHRRRTQTITTRIIGFFNPHGLLHQ